VIVRPSEEEVVTGVPIVSACEYAMDRHRDFRRWRNLWTILLFVFGATVIVFLSLALILFVTANWLPGAVSTIGTIANRAGVAWVYGRRMEAAREEEEAYKDVQQKCFPDKPDKAHAYLEAFNRGDRFTEVPGEGGGWGFTRPL
jgi:hypothetical protein